MEIYHQVTNINTVTNYLNKSDVNFGTEKFNVNDLLVARWTEEKI